jgi:PKHD-type hydroxylase
MFLKVKDVLTQAELDQIRQLAASLRFVEGRVSNPHNLAKNNLQADLNQPDAAKAAQIAGAAIQRNEEVANFAFPKRIASPLLARYEPGMTYGVHADAPFLPLPNGPLRSDVSATLFINDGSTYDGGRLAIHLGSETVTIEPEPGAMILYPSTTLHEVTPVTSGRRLVLYTLNEVKALEGFNMSWENRTRLNYVSGSLHRMWAS